MISEKRVRELVDEWADDGPAFLVDLKISAANQIAVFIDSDNGMTIQECAKLSRHVESELDREVEDFELSVSTPGLDQPLKVRRQYQKNVGREVKVRLKDESSLKGELIGVEQTEIVVKTRSKERIEGRKAKQWVEKEHRLPFEDIVETRIVISFK